jgi:hypothetical protein
MTSSQRRKAQRKPLNYLVLGVFFFVFVYIYQEDKKQRRLLIEQTSKLQQTTADLHLMEDRLETMIEKQHTVFFARQKWMSLVEERFLILELPISEDFDMKTTRVSDALID